MKRTRATRLLSSGISTLNDLFKNLRAGLRLAFFLPVERLAFRIDLPQLLWLFALSAGIDIVGDWFRADPPRELSLLGAGSELYAGALLLLASALISHVQPATAAGAGRAGDRAVVAAAGPGGPLLARMSASRLSARVPRGCCSST